MNNTKRLDDYLNEQMSPADRLLMDAELLIDEKLRDTLVWQKATYLLVRAAGREKLRQEIASVDRDMFQLPRYTTFSSKIKKLFSR